MSLSVKYEKMENFYSIGDLAEELNRRYYKFIEKGEFEDKRAKSRYFLSQIEDLFRRFGANFGYESLSSFRRDIQFSRKNMKKTFVSSLSTYRVEEDETEGIDSVPSEGSNMFTLWQVENYNLNADSY